MQGARDGVLIGRSRPPPVGTLGSDSPNIAQRHAFPSSLPGQTVIGQIRRVQETAFSSDDDEEHYRDQVGEAPEAGTFMRYAPTGALCLGPYGGPRGGGVLMSEAPLYTTLMRYARAVPRKALRGGILKVNG